MSHDKIEDPPETDFSGGQRGRFYCPGAVLVPPVHLDPDVLVALRARAAKEGVSLGVLANQLLREDLELANS